MTSSDSEIARLTRRYQIDPDNESLKSQLLTLFERSGLRYEAQRLEHGYWFEDQRQEEWESRISSWRKLSSLSGTYSPPDGRLKLSEGGRFLVFAEPFGMGGGGTWNVHIFDVESGKRLDAYLTSARRGPRFFSVGSEFLIVSDDELKLLSGALHSKNSSLVSGGRFVSGIGEMAVLSFEDGSLTCWPHSDQRFARSDSVLVGIDWELELLLFRSEKDEGALELRNFAGELVRSFGYEDRRIFYCPGRVDFFVCLRDAWRFCRVFKSGETEEHSFDFNLFYCEHFRICDSGNAFCCFYEGVPRRFEFLQNRFSLREEQGLGMSHRGANVGERVWHPKADIAAILSAPRYESLALWSVAGRRLLNCGKVRFLGFSGDGRRMAVWRSTGQGNWGRIEIWG